MKLGAIYSKEKTTFTLFSPVADSVFVIFYDKGNECELANTFEEAEELYYSIHYKGFIEGQNERNIKNRHPERNCTTSDILKHKKTCPEETIYQIGTLEITFHQIYYYR